MTIVVQDGQSIYDIALRYYGSVTGVDILLQDNDLSIDSDLKAGQVLKVRSASGDATSNSTVSFFEKNDSTVNNFDFIKKSINPSVKIIGGVKAPIVQSDPRKVSDTWVVQSGQSIFDVVLQFYHDISYVQKFLTDNGLTIDDSLTSGQVVKIDTTIVNMPVDNYVINNSDYVDFYTGDLRIIVLSIGDDTGTSNGFAMVQVKGGVLPYSYNWSNGATTQNLNGVSSGAYTLVVTDSILTTATVTVDINFTYVEYYIIDHAGLPVRDHEGAFIIAD
ncbi:MAG: LysM peptidoglycan-binding domain-containing protein [Bacteroidetes bacterium]|nr:LysM peptidoglycan-binding domain-containing protein [Bacteroidota bacterium]